MKIKFIVPSWHYYADPFKHQPYWELYYATHVKEGGHDVSIHDMKIQKKKIFFDRVKEIEESDFYFFWIFKTGDAKEVYSISKYLKEKYPKCITAAGGTHVDMCQEECKNYFDCVLFGPGEKNFLNIINDYKNKSLKKNYISNYKDMPFRETSYPDRSFLEHDKIVNKKLFDQYGDYDGTLVYFSRGCIFKCSYCTYNVPRLLQTKSGDMIKKEIKYLKENYRINSILLKDEVAINPNKKTCQEVMGAIGESDVKWRGQTISIATYDQLKLAKDSGCLELAIGVESVDDTVMKVIDKTWQNEKIIHQFIDNCKKLDLRVKICLILGLPGEPFDIVEKTIKFLEKSNPEFVSLSGFLPVPGSPIAKDPKKFGIKFIDKDWSRYGHLLYRFSDEEEVGLPFEYEEEGPWGKSHNMEQIKNNIAHLQNWLKDRKMTY